MNRKWNNWSLPLMAGFLHLRGKLTGQAFMPR
jgi:hypothetical protein